MGVPGLTFYNANLKPNFPFLITKRKIKSNIMLFRFRKKIFRAVLIQMHFEFAASVRRNS